MGIYGESMTLVTEGKIKNIVKKYLSKVANIFKKIDFDDISDIESFYYDTDDFAGHLEFYKRYFKGNLGVLFCKLTPEQSENYFENVKNIFGTDNFNQISNNLEAYLRKKKFTYTQEDDQDIIKDNEHIMIAFNGMVARNINDAEQSDDQTFSSAVILQAQLMGIFSILIDAYCTDRDNKLYIWKKKAELLKKRYRFS